MAEVESKPWGPPAWAFGALAAEFEPIPRIGVLQAAKRHWLLALLPVLVLVPLATVAALKRTPTYSGEARLVVGRLNLSTPGAIAGFSQAAQDLAATYPLLIDADGVVNPVAHRLHLSPADVRAGVSASEVPTSSVIRIDSTAKSELQAVKLANAAGNSLVAYLATQNRYDPDLVLASRLLQRSELRYQLAKTKLPPANQPLTRSNAKLVAAAATAQAELNGAVQEYDNSLQNQAGAPLLQPLSYAAGASGDRISKLQLAVFAALVAGLLIGLALATLRANWYVRRAFTVPGWEAGVPEVRRGDDVPYAE